MTKLSNAASMADRLPGNMTFSRSVLAINAAAAATVKTTSAIVYALDGIFYQKATLAAQALAVYPGNVFYTQPVNTTVYYVLALDAAGNVRTFQGDYAGQPLQPAGYSLVGTGVVPEVPSDVVPFGLIKVVTNGSTTFLPGTDALDKAGCTFTFYDLAVLPSNDRL